MTLTDSVTVLNGIGKVKKTAFEKLGISTLMDLLFYYPARYEDRTIVKPIRQLQDGNVCSVYGTLIEDVQWKSIRPRLTLYTVHIQDNTGIMKISWFNEPRVRKLRYGDQIVFYGRVKRQFRYPEMTSPSYGYPQDMLKIVPVYRANKDLTQNAIRQAIYDALKGLYSQIIDPIPDNIRKNYNLCSLQEALKHLHFPASQESIEKARRRLVFQELFYLQLSIMKQYPTSSASSYVVCNHSREVDDFINRLPFKLTNAQKRVFNEIRKDMESPKRMNRLVQGDVGSGKTVIALLSMLVAVKSGYQCAFMAPTEILAKQHFKSFSKLLANENIEISLLTGSTPLKEKKVILEDIRTGKAQIVIGTHALIESGVGFNNVGLVVTDEQHRFGVKQRDALSDKGTSPDVLVMTATPIPRTLALILYGNLDISIIDELPPGRKPIKTYAVTENMRERINAFIRKQVYQGRQVYIVCPLVDSSETVEAQSAVDLANKIANDDFRDLAVEVIHGKMDTKTKEDVMNRFSAGQVDILISTTVIEVGVDVPNATVMIVENAERFGLAQLHQLRGRVGRGQHESYCILYNQSTSEEAIERMKVMTSSNDGFVIAEKDMELRGTGEFLGTKQHGTTSELKIANLYRDIEILKNIQPLCKQLQNDDVLYENLSFYHGKEESQ